MSRVVLYLVNRCWPGCKTYVLIGAKSLIYRTIFTSGSGCKFRADSCDIFEKLFVCFYQGGKWFCQNFVKIRSVIWYFTGIVFDIRRKISVFEVNIFWCNFLRASLY